jgi:hypothetical protein
LTLLTESIRQSVFLPINYDGRSDKESTRKKKPNVELDNYQHNTVEVFYKTIAAKGKR